MFTNIKHIIQLIRIKFKSVFFFFLMVWGMQIANAQSHCPVNFNGAILEKSLPDIGEWYGKIVACNGKILQIEKGYKNKPYFLVELDQGGTLWVSGQVESGYEEIGAKIRVMGFFEKTVRQYMPPKVNRDGYHLIAFVVYELDTNQISMRPGQESLVQQWLDGKIPQVEKRRWEN